MDFAGAAQLVPGQPSTRSLKARITCLSDGGLDVHQLRFRSRLNTLPLAEATACEFEIARVPHPAGHGFRGRLDATFASICCTQVPPSVGKGSFHHSLRPLRCISPGKGMLRSILHPAHIVKSIALRRSALGQRCCSRFEAWPNMHRVALTIPPCRQECRQASFHWPGLKSVLPLASFTRPSLPLLL